jgi:hypothetical protein
MRQWSSPNVALLVGLVVVALAATLTLGSCVGEESATAEGAPSSSASTADERAALPPTWVSRYVEGATRQHGQTELVDWARDTSQHGPWASLGKGAHEVGGWGMNADFVAGSARSLGRYVVVAQGDFTYKPRAGAAPLACRSIVLVLDGVAVGDQEKAQSAQVAAYRETVHLDPGVAHIARVNGSGARKVPNRGAVKNPAWQLQSTTATAARSDHGCGSAANQTLRLGNADAGRSVVVAVGDEIDVTLQTIGPGQYGRPVVSSRSVVFAGRSFVGPFLPAGPTQLYRFAAVAAGRARITLPHTGDAPSPRPAYSITVRVR